MQNGQDHGLKNESHSTNQFNNSEYARWLKGITSAQSLKTQSGIEGFLGTNENLQPGHKEPGQE
jgi:hypothetical protein